MRRRPATRRVSIESQRTRLSRRREHDRGDEREYEPAHLEVLRPLSLADEQEPPATISTAPATSAASSGSPRKTTAIAIEKSGAVPITTDVRAAPASRTANVNRNCEMPGAEQPGEHERPDVAS